jgi:hypothetical protein
MTQAFGDRATFSVEIGEFTSPSLRVVDLWAGGKRLTVDDNEAYVSSLVHYMRRDAERVRQRAIKPCPFPQSTPEEIFELLRADQTGFGQQFWFMRWSEIVDNVSMYAYLDGDLVIVFQFRRASHPFPEDRGKVFVARIRPDDFADTVDRAADRLDAER